MASPANRIRIGLVAARWHADLVDRTVEGFRERTEQAIDVDVDVFHIPGAFEIPFFIHRLAASGRYNALAGCALVVDGGIYRHEFVAETVVSALMTIQLSTDVPVFSAILTPHHFHEHDDHQRFFDDHLRLKGHQLADAALQTMSALKVV